MAATVSAQKPQDRPSKRRPFAWMKRIANLKGSSSDNSNGVNKKPSSNASSKADNSTTSQSVSFPASEMQRHGSAARDGEYSSTNGAPSHQSAAPTVATNPETIHSDAAQSKAGTSNTVGGGQSSHDGGENSIFTSSNHSARSLTTTLTTIQSNAPSQVLNQQGSLGSAAAPLSMPPPLSTSSAHASPPASAIPPHVMYAGNVASPSHQPSTYASATANNILTDNASVLTLASSSRRHARRDSLDTGASVRALAPSSAWGGSRESLPLSVLSGVGTIESSAPPTANGPQSQRPGTLGVSAADRTSFHSVSGLVGAASSYHTQKDRFADGSSIRSGPTGHSRADSMTGSTTGVPTTPTSPLAATIPKEAQAKLNRRSTDWKDAPAEQDEGAEHERDGVNGATSTKAQTVPETNGVKET